jgi:hypothetical protein
MQRREQDAQSMGRHAFTFCRLVVVGMTHAPAAAALGTVK